jgi:5-methylcytosine-specific restriction protein B
MSTVSEVLDSWKNRRNALLYGPPGTGKTRLLSDLYKLIRDEGQDPDDIEYDASDTDEPLKLAELGIPLPAKVVWTTFHQSYAYEDFVLGLRPEPEQGVLSLKPWAGVLLDAALELADEQSKYKSVVIFIDEINRGNAARIFGEFLTFLDFDYREEGDRPLPVPLRQLKYNNGISEAVYRIGGAPTTIAQGFTFPTDVYIVATMNSVDRAAVPIDSALARRFDRIELRPDLGVLAEHWGLDLENLAPADDANWQNLTAHETAVYLLDQLNSVIGSEYGSEFELGHGLLMPLVTGDANPWATLAELWDEVMYPQIEDRYASSPMRLVDLLRVDDPAPDGGYAWQPRTTLSGEALIGSVAPVKLAELPTAVVERSLRWLARAR